MTQRIPRILAPVLAVATLGAATVGAISLLSNPERLLRSSFAAALEPSTKSKLPPMAADVPLAASEDFWLTAMRSDGGAPVSKAVVVGDKISMTLDGKERRLEVVSVSEFAPSKTEIDTRAGGVRLVLVTARDKADLNLRPIRFVMELEAAPAPIAAPRSGRTL